MQKGAYPISCTWRVGVVCYVIASSFEEAIQKAKEKIDFDPGISNSYDPKSFMIERESTIDNYEDLHGGPPPWQEINGKLFGKWKILENER